MRRTFVAAAITLSFVAVGCAPQSEVDDLERRIDDLEIELEAATGAISTYEDSLNAATDVIEGEADRAIDDIEEATATAATRLKTVKDEAVNRIADEARAVSAASQDMGDLRSDLDATQGELEETRLWLGDIAHCMVYEADLGRYDFWEATPQGSPFGNRGEWQSGLDLEPQMSHCDR